jgi:hypothetical protein
MIPCPQNDIRNRFKPSLSTWIDYDKDIFFEAFLKGGDEYLLSNPVNLGIEDPFDFRGNISSLYDKPGGHLTYLSHEHKQYLFQTRIPEYGIRIENACLVKTLNSSYYFGNSPGNYGTVALDSLHYENNEPTPTPNILSLDITTHPFIQNPPFFCAAPLSGEIFLRGFPGYRYNLSVNTNMILITKTSCGVPTVWEAPYYQGASQAFYDLCVNE